MKLILIVFCYGYKSHHRLNHSEEFADGKNNINSIENFWGICKVHFAKFRGLNKNTFYLHLKECKFRYSNRDKNNRDKNIYKTLFLIKSY